MMPAVMRDKHSVVSTDTMTTRLPFVGLFSPTQTPTMQEAEPETPCESYTCILIYTHTYKHACNPVGSNES